MPPKQKKTAKKTGKPKRKQGVKPVTQPLARSAIVRHTQPKYEHVRDGMRVRHRELVKVLTAKTNFAWSVSSIPINPGLPGSFPWLSGISRMFEQYKINSLRFDYVPIAPTTYAGSVVLAVDYDPRDQEYNVGLTRVQLFQNATCVSMPCWSKASLPTSTPSLMGGTTRKFVRVYDVDASLSTSVRSSDCGDLIIGLSVDDYEGAIVNRTYGDLWVEYDVTLMNPQPNMNPPALIQTFELGPDEVPAPLRNAWTVKNDAVYGSKVKVDGGLFGYQGYYTTGVDNVKTWWKLIDLIPGAYYTVFAGINEIATGVSDTVSILATDPLWAGLEVVSSVMNRVTSSGGGTSAGVRCLFKALADSATFVLSAATLSGGTSLIRGSFMEFVPTPSLQDPFVPYE